MFRTLLATCATAAALVIAAPAAEAQRVQTGSLRVVVKDPSGGVIPGALVQLKGTEDRTASVMKNDLPSDGQGVASADDLVPGRYSLEVSFAGFETLVVTDLRIRAGENRREAVLKIQK